ncbi:hypothetical protein LSTR_LSTR005293 [Laodelphax striatellus]|uniref:Uncharacterized protein n=1 Tax=Laodelphax striatellus TaxID=195883 RepID=A0A482X947_LAOST|nr:hypothetical protein LSTR_LSTR005293 [Laodelphax striatellus]
MNNNIDAEAKRDPMSEDDSDSSDNSSEDNLVIEGNNDVSLLTDIPVLEDFGNNFVDNNIIIEVQDVENEQIVDGNDAGDEVIIADNIPHFFDSVQDIDIVAKFLENGCGCKKNCCTQFHADELVQMRRDCAEIDFYEHHVNKLDQELIETVEDSTPTSKVNFGIAVGDETGKTNVQSYDWLMFLAKNSTKKIPKLTRFNHFEFSNTHRGVVKCKVEVDDNIFAHRIFPEDEGPEGFPEPINPQGMSIERRNYLYTTIRPYCKEETKDILCPRGENAEGETAFDDEPNRSQPSHSRGETSEGGTADDEPSRSKTKNQQEIKKKRSRRNEQKKEGRNDDENSGRNPKRKTIPKKKQKRTT